MQRLRPAWRLRAYCTAHACPYKVLCVDRSASMEEVQEQFRKLSKLYHPDRFSGGDAKFKAINAAYRQIQEQQKNPHQQSTDTNSATLGFTGIMALTTDMEGWVQTYKRNKPYMAALIVLI